MNTSSFGPGWGEWMHQDDYAFLLGTLIRVQDDSSRKTEVPIPSAAGVEGLCKPVNRGAE